MAITLQDFMKQNQPKETRSQKFLKELKSKGIEKDIDTLLKEGYQTAQISDFIKMNNIKVVVSALNTYLAGRSKELKISRQPKQLNKQTKKGK